MQVNFTIYIYIIADSILQSGILYLTLNDFVIAKLYIQSFPSKEPVYRVSTYLDFFNNLK